MAKALPPFSGHDVECPKCGGAVEALYLGTIAAQDRFFVTDQERLHFAQGAFGKMGRRCRGCSHWWLEMPLDAAKESAP